MDLMVEEVELIYENVESITLNTEAIVVFYLKGLSESIYYQPQKGESQVFTRVNELGIQIEPSKLNVKQDNLYNYDDDTTGEHAVNLYVVDRLLHGNDMTGVRVTYTDGSVKHLSVWHGEQEYINEGLHIVPYNTRIKGDRGIYILYRDEGLTDEVKERLHKEIYRML